jgi:hypothetical protein
MVLGLSVVVECQCVKKWTTVASFRERNKKRENGRSTVNPGDCKQPSDSSSSDSTSNPQQSGDEASPQGWCLTWRREVQGPPELEDLILAKTPSSLKQSSNERSLCS